MINSIEIEAARLCRLRQQETLSYIMCPLQGQTLRMASLLGHVSNTTLGAAGRYNPK